MTEQVEEKLVEEVELCEEASSDSYKVKLKSFDYEGPLDVLLELVKKAKIEIKDIFVSEVTEQYLEYMNALKEIDLDRASEFIETAALLIEFKSRALLPRPEEEKNELDDDQKEFIQRLEEYKLYKEASLKMKELETVGMHFREPDPSMGETKFVLKDMTMDGLMKALQKMFLKLDKTAERPKERQIVMDRFTVQEKIEHIRDIMLQSREVSFFSLFDDRTTKSEVITTFQAILELLKLQYIRAVQQQIYGDITLVRTQEVGV